MFLVGTFSGAVGASDSTESFMHFLLIVAIVCIIIHLVSIFQSKNVRIRLIGPILGLVGHAIYLVCGTYLAWLALFFTLIGAIFLFRDNHYTDLEILPKNMSK